METDPPRSGPRLNPRFPIDGDIRYRPEPRGGRGRGGDNYYFGPGWWGGGLGWGGFWGPGWWGGGFWGDPYWGPGPWSTWGFVGVGPGGRDERVEENVVVRVSPKRTQVLVNGLVYSERGRTEFSLPVGDWVIELRAPGHIPETVELRVDQGVRYRIERKLRKDPGGGRGDDDGIRREPRRPEEPTSPAVPQDPSEPPRELTLPRSDT